MVESLVKAYNRFVVGTYLSPVYYMDALDDVFIGYKPSEIIPVISSDFDHEDPWLMWDDYDGNYKSYTDETVEIAILNNLKKFMDNPKEFIIQ